MFTHMANLKIIRIKEQYEFCNKSVNLIFDKNLLRILAIVVNKISVNKEQCHS